MRSLRLIFGTALFLYGLVLLAAWGGQRWLIYLPDARRIAPAEAGIAGVEERWLTAPDGVRVLSWYGRAKEGQPTLLYFHGNGGHLAVRGSRIQRFQERGWGIYMMAYRGYSGSGGAPSEADNVADARRAYDDLRSLGVPAERIVLFGESLGTGVATQVAVVAKAAGLVLDSPFTSIVEIGRSLYPILPVDWLLAHRYETINYIGRVEAPLLVVHGEADHIVPVDMGRRVYAAAERARSRQLVTIPGAGHLGHIRLGSFDKIAAFVDDVVKR